MTGPLAARVVVVGLVTAPSALRVDGPAGPKVLRVLRFDGPNGQSIKRKALLWAGYGPTSTDLHILCRMCTA